MRIVLILLSAAAFAAAAPADPRYSAACVVVAQTTVEGFVTNRGSGALQVSGPVRFVFMLYNSPSRPVATVQADVAIAAGQTASVGKALLGGGLALGETCQLDASGAVR